MWEFTQPVHMCFVDLEKAFDHVPCSILWEVLWEYEVRGTLLRAVWSLYDRSRSFVRIAGSKSDLFTKHVGLGQGFPLSPVLFIIFMDRISRRSQGAEGHALGWFAAECEAAGMRISTSMSEAMVLDWKRVVCLLNFYLGRYSGLVPPGGGPGEDPGHAGKTMSPSLPGNALGKYDTVLLKLHTHLL
ncbi:hypothetical protein QQF64_009755 [Cirrhinus molitorella]|uniref:Reverse transcriptase domain-containing protein n=1 Tax=Cirrhinus molitorella TaxID=172907 RepID=A0ABR3M226_9TELE